MRDSGGISSLSSEGNGFSSIELGGLLKQNFRYLKKKAYRPVLKAGCIRLICFYQKRLSRHTCLYEPTCSEYTKRCINNRGVVCGILLGFWRILRCNPFSKGGYDAPPERRKVRWLY